MTHLTEQVAKHLNDLIMAEERSLKSTDKKIEIDLLILITLITEACIEAIQITQLEDYGKTNTDGYFKSIQAIRKLTEVGE